MIELDSGHLHRSLNLPRIGKTLARERLAAEESPPPLLQAQPTRAFGNEVVLQAWAVCQPGACLQAVMATQIVCDDEDIPNCIAS